ncbi:hypothetical protein Lal_00013747 [Lupinus albus]|nr:hypothetical protein Lal_00013747 [Lupinus albus]
MINNPAPTEPSLEELVRAATKPSFATFFPSVLKAPDWTPPFDLECEIVGVGVEYHTLTLTPSSPTPPSLTSSSSPQPKREEKTSIFSTNTHMQATKYLPQGMVIIFSSKEVVNHFKVLGARANGNKGTLSSVRVKVVMDSEASFVVPPCLVEIIPLPSGEVEVDRSRAVFRGDIEIWCSYSDRHRVILPRRSTVPAVYIMHLPDGYELRRTPPLAPARYISLPIAPLGLSSGTYHARTRRCTPRASPRRSAGGPPVTPACRTESTRGVQACRCTLCLSVRERHMDSPAIVVRENLEFAPGSSSHGVRGRIQDDGVDIRGPVRRARLSPPPSYSPAPAEPMVRDDIIYISSDEEDPEEDPEEGVQKVKCGGYTGGFSPERRLARLGEKSDVLDLSRL